MILRMGRSFGIGHARPCMSKPPAETSSKIVGRISSVRGQAALRILADIRRLIAEARSHVASTANAALTMLYWRVGQRIRTEVLREKRAAYGDRIVASVGRQLSAEYGAGFEEKNLRRMMRSLKSSPISRLSHR